MSKKSINFWLNFFLYIGIVVWLFFIAKDFNHSGYKGYALLALSSIFPLMVILFYPFNFIKLVTEFKFTFDSTFKKESSILSSYSDSTTKNSDSVNVAVINLLL